MLSNVRFWPFPGTNLRKPAWLTGVACPLTVGDGGVICEVHRFVVLPVGGLTGAPSSSLALACLQACNT